MQRSSLFCYFASGFILGVKYKTFKTEFDFCFLLFWKNKILILTLLSVNVILQSSFKMIHPIFQSLEKKNFSFLTFLLFFLMKSTK